MISEQDFSFGESIVEIFKKIYEAGSFEESNKIIKYFGNKNKIPLEDEPNNCDKNSKKDENNILLNPDDPRNYLLFLNYENIYIGAVSINDISKRENFGLNIYSNDSFYIGRWKNNMKEGIGFLKINENLMYVGNFSNNQFNGFGILYDKKKNNFFFGEFNNGQYIEGIFYNLENEYFYRGKIKDGKKNDDLCTFFDAKKGYLFFGEIINDEFNKGYVYYIKYTEDNQNEEDADIKFNIQKMIFFDGLGENNKEFINDDLFTEDFYNKLQDLGNYIFQSDFNLKDQNQALVKYFNDLDGINKIDKYFNVDNYNSFEDEQCIENEFIKYFYNVFDSFQVGQEKLNLKEYEALLEHQEIIH